MLFGRLVAAQRNTAGLAGTQVHPLIPGFYTFFAHLFFRVFEQGNFFNVLTDFHKKSIV